MSDESVSFNTWLQGPLTVNERRKYRHRQLEEKAAFRAKILPQLKRIVYEAHEDARRRLRKIEDISLDRSGIPTGQDPAEGYPEWLPMSTLMGYFGEILAGLVCENYDPLEEMHWKVPAHLFRFHLEAFRYLERLRHGDVPQPRQVLGRKGDDCLAFALDENGRIIRTMFCEAKCLNKHDKRKIGEAHKKLSDKVSISLDRQQLIDILMDSGDPEDVCWVEALRRLKFQSSDPGHERCDLVCYVCGNPPVRSDTWIPKESPHPHYEGNRRLEAVEVYIHQVRRFVKEVYGKDGDEPD
jgi:hypothetical protein